MEKLDLKTLEHIKYMFEIQSDIASHHNHGYDALCRIIETQKKQKENIDPCPFCDGTGIRKTGYHDVGDFYKEP